MPTVDLARCCECAAVVLHSPLTSGMRVAFPDTKKTCCSTARVPQVSAQGQGRAGTGAGTGAGRDLGGAGRGGLLCPAPQHREGVQITSPVLIIHGTEDEVIDFSPGLALYERCPKAVEPLWVEGAGHNDIELYSQYLERLRRTISQGSPASA